MTAGPAWPPGPHDWAPTRDTLLLWTQVIGKVRMAWTPLTSHWWNVPLYVTARGLTSSLIPHPSGRSFSIDLDLREHQLVVHAVDAAARSRPLQAEPVADFYAGLMRLLDELDLHTDIWTMPVELPDAVPFEQDRRHADYDAEQVRRFWLTLVQSQRVFEQFRSRFVGKSSPVHLFWGALDLAVTRFSGRPAPPHPGGAPNCGPHVMLEAYSHEVASSGYWPGSGDGPGSGGLFYSYAYPEPAGYRSARVQPAQAHFDEALGEYVLDHAVVQAAADPDAVLLEFLQTTYEAAADRGGWDRAALERPSPGAPPATAGAPPGPAR